MINNLYYLSDDEKISDLISNLKRKVKNIESVSGPSIRTMQLREEIARLESLQDYTDNTSPHFLSLVPHDEHHG